MDKMNPLISVIVPVYNVEQCLDRCVESIVNQTYKNLEIILVDDGSPDNCPAMCDEWAKKDGRIKVIHKENGGVSSARNAGLDAAEGDYIAFVDSDDYISSEMFQILIKAINNGEFEVAVCNHVALDVSGETIETVKYKNRSIIDNNEILNAYLTDKLCNPGVCNKLFLKSIIDSVRFNSSIRIGEDFLYNFYAFSNAKSVIVIDTELYYYCDRENSAIHTLDKEWYLRWKNTKKILSELEGRSHYEICCKRYINEFLRCSRELLRCHNKRLIKELYPEFIIEVKRNYSLFVQCDGLSKSNRLSIKMIRYCPKVYMLLYIIFKNSKKLAV